MTDQDESELRTFREFIEAAKLPVVSDSVEKRTPPERDVLCRFEDGETVAFELVEVCNSRNARFMGSAARKHNMIVTAYERLGPQLREAFDQRFIDLPLSFYFRQESSVAYIRRMLPGTLAELASVAERSDEYNDFSPGVAAAISTVRERGRLDAPGEVNFNIGGEYDPIVPLEAVEAKLAKNYQANGPVELLAHFGPLAWAQDRAYRGAFLGLLKKRGFGPFRSVWVKDWQGIGLVVPEVMGDKGRLTTA